MNKHDEKIQNLFDDYAKQLTSREDLADKAIKEMVANNAQPSGSARKNSSFGAHFAWITPVVAVFIAVVILMFNLPLLGNGNWFNKDEPPSEQPTVIYYTYADVKGRSVSLDYCDYVLKLDRLRANGYEIVGEHCYAFYTDNGELRYIKAYLGVRSADGTFTEFVLTAEVDGYVRKDLQDIYDKFSNMSRMVVDSREDSNGEYVTQAFFATRDLHFYAVARNGQYTQVAKDILTIISA